MRRHGFSFDRGNVGQEIKRLRKRALRSKGNGSDYHVVDTSTRATLATVDKYAEALALRLEYNIRKKRAVTILAFNGENLARAIFNGDVHVGWRRVKVED